MALKIIKYGLSSGYFMTSWGVLSAAWDKDGLRYLTLPQKEISQQEEAVITDKPVGFLAELAEEIEGYFQGDIRSFSFPYRLPEGPPFFHKAWRVLKDVSYGQVLTYGELAQAAGNGQAVRAAGAAMRNNPLPLIVPCHRVIAGDYSLGGFSGKKVGEPLVLKKKLLLLEGHSFDGHGRLISRKY